MKRGLKGLTGCSDHKKGSHGSATLGKINFTEIITYERGIYMQVDSQKAKKALAAIRETLLDLGFEDFVLSTLSEDQNGKVQYQTVFEGNEVTIAHILMNLEEETPEEAQDHIAKHKLIEVLKILEGDHDEI